MFPLSLLRKSEEGEFSEIPEKKRLRRRFFTGRKGKGQGKFSNPGFRVRNMKDLPEGEKLNGLIPLCHLHEGERGEIIETSGIGCHGRATGHERKCKGHGRIADLGLRVGKTVELLQKGKRGPLLVKVDESRIAIGRGMARNILIKHQ